MVLLELKATRNKVTAKPRSYCRGCHSPPQPPQPPSLSGGHRASGDVPTHGEPSAIKRGRLSFGSAFGSLIHHRQHPGRRQQKRAAFVVPKPFSARVGDKDGADDGREERTRHGTFHGTNRYCHGCACLRRAHATLTHTEAYRQRGVLFCKPQRRPQPTTRPQPEDRRTAARTHVWSGPGSGATTPVPVGM